MINFAMINFIQLATGLLQTDIQLFKAIQDGDEKAFDAFFKRHYIALCTYSKHFVSLEDAEEIVQDVMIWIWENRTVLIPEAAPLNYLYKSVKNRCINLLNHKNMESTAFNKIKENLPEGYDPEDTIDYEKLTNDLKSALEKIPDSYRESFELNRFQNLTYKEIGNRLGISHKTVEYRIQQALKILRVCLKDYFTLLLFWFINRGS